MRALLGLSLCALLAACGAGGSSGGTAGGPAPSPTPAPSSTPTPTPAPSPGHLNVLVFLVDDLGWRDTGFMGSTFYDTPNVDKLASEGMRFNQAYAAAPLCSPSRAALMSGESPPTTGITNVTEGAYPTPTNSLLIPPASSDRLQLSVNTIAERFKQGGYATMFAGKWHLGPTGDYWPEKQGFDVNAGGWGAGAPNGAVKGREYFSPYRNPRLKDGPDGEYLEDRLANETINFIRGHQTQPFFVVHAFYSVHPVINAIDPYYATYQAKVAALPGGTEPFRVASYNIGMKAWQNLADYGSMVSAMDGEVGKILAELDQDGLTSKTIVIFTSDNGGLANYGWGTTSNEPLRGGKGWLYEGGIRVPLIIKAPGVTQAGSHTEYPATTVDLVPTLLHLANLPSTDPTFEGIDLFQSDPLPVERDLYWHFPHYWGGSRPVGAIRSGDWKLIEFFEGPRSELYNLATDPGETQDVASLRPDIVAVLHAKLEAWRAKDGALMPTAR